VLIPINKLYDCIQYHKIRIRTDEGLINVTNTVNSQQSGMYDHDRSVMAYRTEPRSMTLSDVQTHDFIYNYL